MAYVLQYSQARSLTPRAVFRHIALSSLSGFYKATGWESPALLRNRVHFLYLHHLFSDEQDSFRKLLSILSLNHHFISYSEAVDRILKGEVDRPYLAVSFDDGLKSCLTAADILKEFGGSACFFVCPAMLDEKDYEKAKAFCASRLGLPPVEFLSWNDVETLQKAGHEIGSHTMTHANLAELSPQQAQEEIGESFHLLRKRIGPIHHFAWPFGKFTHFSPSARQMVFQAGFKSCASAERGCHVAGSSLPEFRLCIRREHIIAKWPVNHILYFLAKSSRAASPENNEWPGWECTSR